MIKERFSTRLENIVIIFHPCLFWQRVGVEQFVTCLFCSLNVLLNRLHFWISRSEELFHPARNFVVSQPAKLAEYCESFWVDRLRPCRQRVCETNVISCAFRPKQINFKKDIRNI